MYIGRERVTKMKKGKGSVAARKKKKILRKRERKRELIWRSAGKRKE